MPGWFHFSSGYFAQQILGMPEMEHPRMPNFDIKEYGKSCEGKMCPWSNPIREV
jgi:hypothetical protein